MNSLSFQQRLRLVRHTRVLFVRLSSPIGLEVCLPLFLQQLSLGWAWLRRQWVLWRLKVAQPRRLHIRGMRMLVRVTQPKRQRALKARLASTLQAPQTAGAREVVRIAASIARESPALRDRTGSKAPSVPVAVLVKVRSAAHSTPLVLVELLGLDVAHLLLGVVVVVRSPLLPVTVQQHGALAFQRQALRQWVFWQAALSSFGAFDAFACKSFVLEVGGCAARESARFVSQLIRFFVACFACGRDCELGNAILVAVVADSEVGGVERRVGSVALHHGGWGFVSVCQTESAAQFSGITGRLARPIVQDGSLRPEKNGKIRWNGSVCGK